jgi:hypothetical protein
MGCLLLGEKEPDCNKEDGDGDVVSSAMALTDELGELIINTNR